MTVPATPITVTAREVGRVAAAHAARADADRRLSGEVAAAISAAGFSRHFVQARWGGTEGTFTDLVAMVEEIAEGDASAAWCASIAATLGRMAGFLPPAGQSAIWSSGPDALIAGALMPAGDASAAPGGWVVSGSWAYLSGIHHSDHALVCCPVPTADGPEVRFLLVPRSAYAVNQTWFTVGMRGTGSDTLALEPTFVPHSHSFARADLITGRAVASAARCHRVPLKGVSGLSFASPLLGAAVGALRTWSAGAARKRASPTAASRISGGTDATTELTLARSAGEIDAARLLLNRAAADADRGLPGPLVVRAQRDHALATDLLLDAVHRLARTVGTRGQDEADGFQRFWRDADAAAGHAVLAWEPAARAYAQAALDAALDAST